MSALITIVKLLATYQGGLTLKENLERHRYWNQAREYADRRNKPLLVVGMKRWVWEPPNGDVTVDLDPIVENIPGGVCASECDMPFMDKEFGAVYNAHTLEHMLTAEDLELAVNENIRVSDKTIFLCPSPWSIIGNFFCPAHHFRLWFDQTNNRIKITDNRWRTGLGLKGGGQFQISQSFVTETLPEIVKIGNSYQIGR